MHSHFLLVMHPKNSGKAALQFTFSLSPSPSVCFVTFQCLSVTPTARFYFYFYQRKGGDERCFHQKKNQQVSERPPESPNYKFSILLNFWGDEEIARAGEVFFCLFFSKNYVLYCQCETYQIRSATITFYGAISSMSFML